MNPLTIIFKPKSILGLLVAAGIVGLFIGASLTDAMPNVAANFNRLGGLFFMIGLIGWLFYIIPAITKLWK